MHIFIENFEIPAERSDKAVNNVRLERFLLISDSVVDLVDEVFLKNSGVSFGEIVKVHSSAITFH